jgi:probable selenium-dependent hydroxylase accessory protein YqeC
MPQLCDLIHLPAHSLIAIVGAGGKTTTMYTLASELAQRGKRVITTTTTQIFFPKQDETDALIFAAETSSLLKKIDAAWKQHNHITVTGLPIREDKLGGLQPEQTYELHTKSGADAIIVEADGARHKMIKAPAEHEPVIPARTNVALLLMSAGAINQTLSAEIAHRPEQIAMVVGVSMGDILSPAVIAKLMTSERGALKHIPETAASYLLITHASLTNKEPLHELISLVRHSARITGVVSSGRPGEWVTV